MLSVLGGEETTSANLDKVLFSVGIDADSWRMYRVTQADGGQLVECRIQIFRYLQNRTRVVVWLYENVNTRIEGQIVGFDEYMNLVLDEATEEHTKRNTSKPLGRIMLKGDNITLIQSKDGSNK